MNCSYHLIYDSDVRIEARRFATDQGCCEYHVILHAVRRESLFENQLSDLKTAFDRLPNLLGEKVTPLFRRFFLSDAANQAPLLESLLSKHCATSVVQQAPMDGSKIALWVYLRSDANMSGDYDTTTASANSYRHIWTAGRCVPLKNSYDETLSILGKYVTDLYASGCTLYNDCIRTWFFVQNVDVNYGGVVKARRELFERHGLTPQTHFIASTGIEGRHADPQVSVLFDAYSVRGLKPGQQQFLYASTHLNPTYEYGVTFERGTKVIYGDRSHIFISGTASIDNKGEIVAPGNIAGQAERMLENIETLLAEAGATCSDLMQMIVYLRDPADYNYAARLFEERFNEIPHVIVLAPVCRPGWLIETECIAITGNGDTAFAPY